jgi:hypothetical protein
VHDKLEFKGSKVRFVFKNLNPTLFKVGVN